MARPYPVIPALPVAVPFAVTAFGAAVWWLRRWASATALRVATAAVASTYAAGLLQSVLLPFPVRVGHDRDGMVGWWRYLQLVPVVTADPIGIVLNVALFVPLGLLLPLVARVRSAGRVLVVALLVSLAIEVVQFGAVTTVTSGRTADVDDLIANAVGALVGFGAFRLVTLVPGVARLADAATWPAPDPASPGGVAEVPGQVTGRR